MSGAVSRPSSRALLQAALDAAARGFHVFPVAPGGKVPALRETNWKKVATRSEEQLRRWFDARAYNIGIATGPSELVVIDLDDAHGEPAPPRWPGARHGLDVLGALAIEAGCEVPLQTYSVATPSGGLHLYFRRPLGLTLGNSAARLGWRIDTRAEGGYVVGAGSRRSRSAGGGRYRVVRPVLDVAPLPPWLARALTPPPAPARPPSARTVSAPHVLAYVAAAVRSEADAVAAAPRGTRNVRLLHAARVCGEFIGGGYLAEAEATQALYEAAAHHIRIAAFTEYEALRTIRRGIAYGRQRPRQLHPTARRPAGATT